jgi:hypothetical protein
MKKKVKKKGGDRIESVLKILIPNQARKASDNAGWCGTVKDRSAGRVRESVLLDPKGLNKGAYRSNQ